MATEKKKKRFTVRVHLTSGRVIKFRCREFKYVPGQSYSYSGAPIRTLWFRRRRPLSLSLEHIVAVEVTGV
jgi:hypothetical protein